MTNPKTMTTDLQNQILDTIRKSQETVVEAIKTWADTIQSVTPSLPIPNVPGVPFTDKLP